MVFWTGWGFLVPVLVGAGAGTVIGIMTLLGQNTTNRDIVIVPLTFLLGSIYTFLFHKYVLAKTEVVRELIDPATQQKVVFKRSNSLFFVPFRFWPWILATLMVVSFISISLR